MRKKEVEKEPPPPAADADKDMLQVKTLVGESEIHTFSPSATQIPHNSPETRIKKKKKKELFREIPTNTSPCNIKSCMFYLCQFRPQKFKTT